MVENTKEQTYFRILEAVIQLEVENGHLQWRITDLARRSGVKRTLIYYYFGNSKKELLLSTLQGVRELFKVRTPTELRKLIMLLRKKFLHSPDILLFYLRNRGEAGDLGELLRELENALKRQIAQHFAAFFNLNQEIMFAVFFGYLLAPQISSRSIAYALRTLQQDFSNTIRNTN